MSRALKKTPKAADEVSPGAPSDPILDGIREAITRQRLPPGTKLHEEALGGIFGVSRTRIRAALHRLQHTGLVTSGRKQIARVAQPSIKEAREMFAARRLVEPSIAAEVARRVTPEIRLRLDRLLKAERLARDRGDRVEAIRLAGEFHVVLAEIAGNSVVTRFIREIVDRTFLVIFMYQSAASPSCVHSEHSQLLGAIGEGKAERAAAVMLRHIDLIESRMTLEEREESSVDLKKAFDGIV